MLTGISLLTYTALIYLRYSLYFKKVAKALLSDANSEDYLLFDLKSAEYEVKAQSTTGKVKFEAFDGYRVCSDKIFFIKKHANYLFLFREGFESDRDFTDVIECLQASELKKCNLIKTLEIPFFRELVLEK